MTKKQLEYLRLLGYLDTYEEGATLYHPLLSDLDAYVWEEDTFSLTLGEYPKRVENTVRKRVAAEILNKRPL